VLNVAFYGICEKPGFANRTAYAMEAALKYKRGESDAQRVRAYENSQRVAWFGGVCDREGSSSDQPRKIKTCPE